MNSKQRLEFYKSKIGQNGVKDWREVANKNHYWSKSLARNYHTINPPREGSAKRWIENTSFMREVGLSDKIINLRHTGWYADENGGVIYSGFVWQLPARKGKELFVYGYKDPENEGAAFIDFDYTESKENAARWADSMAEYDAEKEREYEARSSAECEIECRESEIIEYKSDLKDLLKERRALKLQGFKNDTVCKLMAKEARSFLAKIRHARKEIENLKYEFNI